MIKFQETVQRIRRRLNRLVGRQVGVELAARCYDCGHKIERNDDALICIKCGGYNHRLPRERVL